LLFNVIHGMTEDQNRELISRALAALRPGGRLYILDQMKWPGRGGTRLSRFIPQMVGLNLVNETGGTVYDVGRVKEWCGVASNLRQWPLRRMPGVSLVEAER
jgi:hypothetical protein